MSITVEKRVFGMHTPTQSRAVSGGEQHHFDFPNGRGASVVRHAYSYGHERGLWELAVLNEKGELDYSTPITDDVLGNLSESDVASTLDAIAALPPEVAP